MGDFGDLILHTKVGEYLRTERCYSEKILGIDSPQKRININLAGKKKKKTWQT